MIEDAPFWQIPLRERPAARLMAVGVHGPDRTERFVSPECWTVHLYRYTARIVIDGVALPIRPGYCAVVPPGIWTEYQFGEKAVHLCAHFDLPPAADGGVRVPAMQDLGDDFAPIYAAFEEGAACFASNRDRAEVRLWDVLWRIADRSRADRPPDVHAHPAPLQQAREIIELRLNEPMSVGALAAEVGLSHNHLTRLFRSSLGCTVVGYIRDRRVERARHLLEGTTLPIKTVSAQVGVEDVRLFYKIIREALGVSPTEVRSRARGGGASGD